MNKQNVNVHKDSIYGNTLFQLMILSYTHIYGPKKM